MKDINRHKAIMFQKGKLTQLNLKKSIIVSIYLIGKPGEIGEIEAGVIG